MQEDEERAVEEDMDLVSAMEEDKGEGKYSARYA